VLLERHTPIVGHSKCGGRVGVGFGNVVKCNGCLYVVLVGPGYD